MVINPADYSRVKRMNFKELNNYIYNLYAQGRADAKEELLGGYDEAVVLTPEGFEERLFTIPWMTSEEFEDIYNALTCEMSGDDDERNEQRTSQ